MKKYRHILDLRAQLIDFCDIARNLNMHVLVYILEMAILEVERERAREERNRTRPGGHGGGNVVRFPDR